MGELNAVRETSSFELAGGEPLSGRPASSELATESHIVTRTDTQIHTLYEDNGRRFEHENFVLIAAASSLTHPTAAMAI